VWVASRASERDGASERTQRGTATARGSSAVVDFADQCNDLRQRTPLVNIVDILFLLLLLKISIFEPNMN